MKFRFSGLAAVALASALLAPSAHAAPVSVQLRIEGPTRTLFEGPVTTDVRTFHFTSGSDTTEHRCDGTSSENGGPSPVPVPTRGGAIITAAEQNGFGLKGTWYAGLGPGFTEINGENVDYDSTTNSYLVEYNNGQPTSYGSCADQIANRDDVLFAYGDGTETILKLTGPATARPGETAAVKVIDQGNGLPVAGATVDGRTTGADGSATVGPYDARGNHDLKATRAHAIRSNRVRICVTDGADGFCGTTTPTTGGGTSAAASEAPGASQTSTAPSSVRDLTAPRGSLALKEGHVYPHGQGPRLLKGAVTDDPSGLLMVKLRLTRDDGGTCSGYSSTRERFIRTKCGVAHGWYFKLGSDAAWSYLLPEKLGPGRYVLDVQAVDKAYNRDAGRRRGQNRVVFTVE
jgi:hypothetical protein